jgi:serine/threonine protein kinase
MDKFKEEEYLMLEKLKNASIENLIIYFNKKEFKDLKLTGLVMEYVNGGDLKSYVDKKDGYFSPKEIFNLIKQICLIIFFLVQNLLFLIFSLHSRLFYVICYQV